jgi:hypothetical protein
MTEKTRSDVPDAVKNIVGAMLDHALARCDREGITWNDFYAALLEEQSSGLKGSVEDLFERTFARLKKSVN